MVSVSSRGQATIPKQFREELGIDTPGRMKFVRTDEQGRSATERLREERAADDANEAELRQRYADDDETTGDGSR